MRSLVAIAALATGCASSYQSARTLAPGKTQVTVALTRAEEASFDGQDESIWFGDLQIRHGLSDRADGGFRIQRNPGAGENVSMVSVDPKVRLSAPKAKTTLSLALPLSALWAESGTDFEDGSLVISPTLFIGVDVSPGVELVISPKTMLLVPEGDPNELEVEFGASIGVRIGDATRAWAVHPELGFVHLSDGDGETFVSFGIGISAGN